MSGNNFAINTHTGNYFLCAETYYLTYNFEINVEENKILTRVTVNKKFTKLTTAQLNILVF